LTSRETIDTDVVIVGAGPAGLSAAIRIKQLDPGIGVIVVEKSATVGGHILSGGVMDPAGLSELIPDWRERGAPVGPTVQTETLHLLTERQDLALPGWMLPSLMKTRDGVIVSLGDLVVWLGQQAEQLGVDIFSMTAAVDILTDTAGAVAGVVTGALGVDRDAKPKPGYAPGTNIAAKYTLIAEGARGSLARRLIEQFKLDAAAGPQKYGLGVKEVWQVRPDRHQEGRVDHYLGYPLGAAALGGGFCYHARDQQVYLGLIVHLDYADPSLSPFEEFQRFKRHPSIAGLLAGATRTGYGARAVTSGGWQSVPELSFPGGALVGCAAGFMNTARLKAIHSAFRSGKAAAETLVAALHRGRARDHLDTMTSAVLATGIGPELFQVRNVKPLWSRFGTPLGAMLGGLDMLSTQLVGASPFGTQRHQGPDHLSLAPQAGRRARSYPAHDGVSTYDRTKSIYLSNITHDEDQPTHLTLKDAVIPIVETLAKFGLEPSTRYCPAAVYAVSEGQHGPRFQISAQNCIHCKTCDIKDPAQNIVWVPPEGGSGPNYRGM
jgi:electron-transferring-flavoprotein dehydrogenase